VNLQDVLKLLHLRRDKQHACTCSFEVEGAVEVHYPVFRPLVGRGILISVHSDTKSARIYDLIACLGQNLMSNSPSSSSGCRAIR
jgi:hypothetical protein